MGSGDKGWPTHLPRMLGCEKIWCEALFDRSEVFHTGLSFAAVGGRRLPGHLDQSMSDWEWADGVKREMTCVSFIMKPCDWKFGVHVVETLFCFVNLQIVHVTHTF